MALHDLTFRDVEHLLPRDTLVVLNHSRVITARLHMAKQDTGGGVEVYPSTFPPPPYPFSETKTAHANAIFDDLSLLVSVAAGAVCVARGPVARPGAGAAGDEWGGGVALPAGGQEDQARHGSRRQTAARDRAGNSRRTGT